MYEVYRTPERTITVRTGSEGPRHDPYSYTETEVARPGWPTVTLHTGLGVWLKFERKGSPAERVEFFKNEGVGLKVFEEYLGCTLRAFEKAAARVNSVCRECGLYACDTMAGYPGESFDVCPNGHVVHTNFHPSEVE